MKRGKNKIRVGNPKFRIRIENESDLSTIFDSIWSWWKIGGISVLFILLSIFLGMVIVFVSPLHTFLPGYLKEDQRAATEDNLLRLDSLRSVYETNQRFIDNFLRVTDIARIPTDSASIKIDSLPALTDSLILPTEREKKFVARMEEQERFNISVLAPLAADGMAFSNISEAAVFSSSSKDSDLGEVFLPVDDGVLSVADGTVIAAYFSRKDNGFIVIIQHHRGFVSRYSHLGSPLVVLGESVEAGQMIASAPSPDKSGKRVIYIRMWHNGLPVIPYRFIYYNEISRDKLFDNENSYEAPRGR